ncbi:GNAT family N-acetyltransferase [Virgibacillus siamensis]|uniref:GNAT family N-acetyltransferase n=1 Tax=Virgibacillus siamensis TaxID=480071 RepID=UPI0031CE01B3
MFKQNSFDDINVCNRGSGIVLDHNNDVIGFIVAKVLQEKLVENMDENLGWIQTILVDKTYRLKGIGTALLSIAENELKQNNAHRIRLGGDPWHYFPGIPQSSSDLEKWFTSKGYSKTGIEFDLINHPSTLYSISFNVNKDVHFSLLQNDEKEDLLSFLKECFPGRWEYEAFKYFESGGSGRGFVVLKKSERIIGFCRINDRDAPLIAQNVYWDPLFNQKVGGIGPLGIDPNEQKKGYGIEIVKAAISFLQKRSIDTFIIDWTSLTAFYAKLGFDKWKSYSTYIKHLK